MTPKTTPSGRALEYFIKMCDSMALDPNAACNPELKTIRIALLRSQAIESGELKRTPPSNPESFNDYLADAETQIYDSGYNRCLESLKGIGHEIPVQK